MGCINLIVGLIAKYSRLADVSPSVILSSVSLSSFCVALLFYIIYKERITLYHIVGMLLIVLCVTLVAISKSGPDSYSKAD